MGGGPGLQNRQFRINKINNPPGMGCCILLRFHYDQEAKFALVPDIFETGQTNWIVAGGTGSDPGLEVHQHQFHQTAKAQRRVVKKASADLEVACEGLLHIFLESLATMSGESYSEGATTRMSAASTHTSTTGATTAGTSRRKLRNYLGSDQDSMAQRQEYALEALRKAGLDYSSCS